MLKVTGPLRHETQAFVDRRPKPDANRKEANVCRPYREAANAPPFRTTNVRGTRKSFPTKPSKAVAIFSTFSAKNLILSYSKQLVQPTRRLLLVAS